MIELTLCVGDPLERARVRAFVDQDPAITVVSDVTSLTTAEWVAVGAIRVHLLDEQAALGLPASMREPAVPGRRSGVIVLADNGDEASVARALNAGACGFLLMKSLHPAELVAAIHVVALGHFFLCSAVVDRLVIPLMGERGHERVLQAREALTDRELEVLQMLAQGHSTDGLASVLHIEESTVRSHVMHILRKLGVRNRTQAVAFACHAGLVRPGAWLTEPVDTPPRHAAPPAFLPHTPLFQGRNLS
ncbi:MAG TPA: response regulator transcription factor [Streptosporangiaceae bacterium]|nr:response regulator transcription factor [Streptosporangiaceae bacterium]